MKDADFAPIGPNSAAGTPDKHFDTLLYTGDGKADRRIGGLNFQPDLVWGFARNASPASGHWLYDSVRGATKQIESSSTNTESTQPTMLTEFNQDGFSMGSDTAGNKASTNFVAWCWKAGNKTTVNNDGTIQSTTSVNSDAGFSIVSYTGNGVANSTVGHGLGVKPDVIIIKNRDNAGPYWSVIHSAISGTSTTDTNILYLNRTDAVADDTNIYGDNIPTTTTFGVDDYRGTNYSNENFIAYCWHNVEGYSKFGKYSGNGNADGPFVYLGFKPAWVMLKTTGTNSWCILDNKRDTTNPVDRYSLADDTGAEGTSGLSTDFLSNGFKLRTTSAAVNANGVTYIYMAFAEMPFKYATGR